MPIESLYGSIEDPWVAFAFAATQLPAILVTVINRPKSTGNRKADDEYAVGREATWHHYHTVYATGYGAI